MSDRDIAAALDRAKTQPIEYENWTVGIPLTALKAAFMTVVDDRATLAGEVERLTHALAFVHRHLERFMDSADAGFRRAEVEDINEPEPASDVYQWARNYAYSIRHPDSPMGQVLTMLDRPEPAVDPASSATGGDE